MKCGSETLHKRTIQTILGISVALRNYRKSKKGPCCNISLWLGLDNLPGLTTSKGVSSVPLLPTSSSSPQSASRMAYLNLKLWNDGMTKAGSAREQAYSYTSVHWMAMLVANSSRGRLVWIKMHTQYINLPIKSLSSLLLYITFTHASIIILT